MVPGEVWIGAAPILERLELVGGVACPGSEAVSRDSMTHTRP